MDAFLPGKFIRVFILGYRLIDRDKPERRKVMQEFEKNLSMTARPHFMYHCDGLQLTLAQEEFAPWAKFCRVE